MNNTLEQIVNTVLYEGCLLYPYPASSQKNQHERFTFGRVYPRDYSDSQNGRETCLMQVECLLQTQGAPPELEITAGFLQPIRREIGVLPVPLAQLPDKGELEFKLVPRLEVNGKVFQTGLEVVQCKVPVTPGNFSQPEQHPFCFVASRQVEPILNEDGSTGGIILRSQELIQGVIKTEARSLGNNLSKVSVLVLNHSPMAREDFEIPENVLQRTFVSTHVILRTGGGAFVSLLEAPPEFGHFAAGCKNIGVWPVLLGDEAQGERSLMLASPIVLYDYPEVAPESAGDFCVGTEIDEMLVLRGLAMTDAEKREMRADDFSRRILERTQGLEAESILKLPGRMREANPVSAANGFTGELFNPARPVTSVLIHGTEESSNKCMPPTALMGLQKK